MELIELSRTRHVTKLTTHRVLDHIGINKDSYKKNGIYDFTDDVVDKFDQYFKFRDYLCGIPNLLETTYNTTLTSRNITNVFLKASAILYLLDKGLTVSEIGRIFKNNHATIIHYRDKYSDFSHDRLFNLIREDVNQLMEDYCESYTKS